jgi:2-polyprenyl-3-methyl-5-hydroxy-6-metoxy-1,4-benzoquinol methylase
VFDGGTLEHIFDYPTAIKNCMKMVKPGGHLLLTTPANNWFGHGFYQFSPELFYSFVSFSFFYTRNSVWGGDKKSR